MVVVSSHYRYFALAIVTSLVSVLVGCSTPAPSATQSQDILQDTSIQIPFFYSQDTEITTTFATAPTPAPVDNSRKFVLDLHPSLTFIGLSQDHAVDDWKLSRLHTVEDPQRWWIVPPPTGPSSQAFSNGLIQLQFDITVNPPAPPPPSDIDAAPSAQHH
jgi:hypothetical protein